MKITASLLTLALLSVMGSAQASIITIGDGASALLPGDIAIGDRAVVTPGSSIYSGTAIGPDTRVINGGVAFGDGAFADSSATPGVDGDKSHAFGINSRAENGAMAIGQDAFATNMTNTDWQRSIAIGTSTIATNGSVSLGSYSSNNGRANAVSIGNSQPSTTRWGNIALGPIYRQLINVGAGTQDHDAVIVQQVIPAIGSITNALGGGSSYDPISGAFTGPTYNLSMGSYTNVNDALVAIDNKPTGPGGTDPYFKGQGDGQGGDAAVASSINSVAAGPRASSTAYGATTVGAMASTTGEAGSAFGHQASVQADGGTALGAYTLVTARCTSIGYGSECSEDNTVSFSRDGEQDQRLLHVADGQADTDAANMGQVRTVDARVSQTQTVVANQAAWFGGGASYDPASGAFNGPSYNFLSGAIYTDVGSALADLDARVASLEELPPGGTGPTGPQGPQGPAGQDGADGQDGSDGQNGANGDDGDSAYEVAVENGFEGTEQEWLESLEGADGRDGRDGAGNSRYFKATGKEDGTDDAKINGKRAVAAGANAEVNADGGTAIGDGAKVNAGATNAVAIGSGSVATEANTMSVGSAGNERRVVNVAPGRIAQGSTDAVNGGQVWELDDRWNQRFDNFDKRISGVCAMGAAQAQAIGAAAANGARRKASAGIGYCGGQAAMSANLSWDATTPSGSVASFSIGVSSTGDDTSIGGGVSFGW